MAAVAATFARCRLRCRSGDLFERDALEVDAAMQETRRADSGDRDPRRANAARGSD